MLYSRICNMHSLGYLEEVITSSVFLTSDKRAFEIYKEMKINIFLIDLGSGFDMDMSYGTDAYYMFMYSRTVIVNELLKKGVTLALIESDAYWRGDVLAHINRLRLFLIIFFYHWPNPLLPHFSSSSFFFFPV